MGRVLLCRCFGTWIVAGVRQLGVALISASCCAVLFSAPLLGWSFEGHRRVVESALELLPPTVPLDRARFSYAIEGSVLPDYSRPPSLLQLRDQQNPQHYINLEPLGDRVLPSTRSDYIRRVAELASRPDRPLGESWTMSSIGVLPYAVIESMQRLAVVFRQIRADPEGERLQFLALHSAGVMSHYAADLCQPLHTTIHHDGRSEHAARSPRSGVHDAVDRIFEAIALDTLQRSPRLPAKVFEDPFSATLAELASSHSEVDRVYELEEEIMVLRDGGVATEELLAFSRDRFQAAVMFTARLIVTAWEVSRTVELPTD